MARDGTRFSYCISDPHARAYRDSYNLWIAYHRVPTGVYSKLEARSEGLSMKDLPYLRTDEAAELLRVAPKTLRNKVAAGFFREGEHFFRRRGLGIRWNRDALLGWMAGGALDPADAIPMARANRPRAVASASAEGV